MPRPKLTPTQRAARDAARRVQEADRIRKRRNAMTPDQRRAEAAKNAARNRSARQDFRAEHVRDVEHAAREQQQEIAEAFRLSDREVRAQSEQRAVERSVRKRDAYVRKTDAEKAEKKFARRETGGLVYGVAVVYNFELRRFLCDQKGWNRENATHFTVATHAKWIKEIYARRAKLQTAVQCLRALDILFAVSVYILLGDKNFLATLSVSIYSANSFFAKEAMRKVERLPRKVQGHHR